MIVNEYANRVEAKEFGKLDRREDQVRREI
jgi:hypothetical protein